MPGYGKKKRGEMMRQPGAGGPDMMPPGDADMMPPGDADMMPQDGADMMPPAGAATSPEELADLAAQEQQARAEYIAANLPPIKENIEVMRLEKLATALYELGRASLPEDFAPEKITAEVPEDAKNVDFLPLNLVVPAQMILQLIQDATLAMTGDVPSKYSWDIAEWESNDGVLKAEGIFRLAKDDADLVQALGAPIAPGEEYMNAEMSPVPLPEEAPTDMPDEFDAEDEELMAMM